MASSFSSTFVCSYDVYSSFHGDDVRKQFLCHLYKEFASKQITVFDNTRMERGAHTIRPEHVKVIRKSKVSIVVFSKKYASSRWQLDELVEICKCKETLGQTVMPIFYEVDSYEVKKQMGDFGKAFEETCKGETEEVKQRWRKALAHVAAIARENFQNWYNEANIIEKIAVHISMKITIKPLR